MGRKTRRIGLGVAVCWAALTALSSGAVAQSSSPLPSTSRTAAALAAWSNFPVHASPRPLVLPGLAMLMGLKVDFHFMKDEADKLPTRKRHAYWAFALGYPLTVLLGGVIGFAVSPAHATQATQLTHSAAGDGIGVGVALVASIPIALCIGIKRPKRDTERGTSAA